MYQRRSTQSPLASLIAIFLVALAGIFACLVNFEWMRAAIASMGFLRHNIGETAIKIAGVTPQSIQFADIVD